MWTSLRDTREQFGSRFEWLCDSLLRRVQIEYGAGPAGNITVWISTRDAERGPNGWSLISLRLTRTREYRIHQLDNTSHCVLSFGIHVHALGEELGVDFSGLMEPPFTLADLRTADFYVVAREVEWRVEGPEN
ncbi:MAG: hypothetical protein LW650_12060 [Planctomycetaceae bacterium]|jgi:hypothetical protein|nr:hypothetical protein [Phycisphaerales bacterium]MCE2654160.1 hypothetical protein [Planctomycetaceae bacterium]